MIFAVMAGDLLIFLVPIGLAAGAVVAGLQGSGGCRFS
jgi:hypothetical protein